MTVISNLIDDLVASRRRTLSLGRISIPWPIPIAYGLHSSDAMVFGCPVFGSDAPRYIKLFHHVFRQISDLKYWLLYRLHPRYRYHMIDTRLGYGYHERDDQLMYGAMTCLIGYVEDCEASGCHDPGDEARAILHWWRVTRPADRTQVSKWMSDLYEGKDRMKFIPVPEEPRLSEIVFDPLSDDDAAKQKAMWELERKIHADEQTFLHRLIDIRPSMWT